MKKNAPMVINSLNDLINLVNYNNGILKKCFRNIDRRFKMVGLTLLVADLAMYKLWRMNGVLKEMIDVLEARIDKLEPMPEQYPQTEQYDDGGERIWSVTFTSEEERDTTYGYISQLFAEHHRFTLGDAKLLANFPISEEDWDYLCETFDDSCKFIQKGVYGITCRFTKT